MTADKLSTLGEPGNWKVVYFLCSHRDTRHLPLVARTSPAGLGWQQCAFHECSMRYVGILLRAVVPRRRVQAAAEHVLAEAERLSDEGVEARLVDRVSEIVVAARAMCSALPPA